MRPSLGLRSGDATVQPGHSVPSGVRWKNVVDTERIPVSSAGEFFSQTTFLLFKEEKKKKFLRAL